jgi:hypothetical protein
VEQAAAAKDREIQAYVFMAALYFNHGRLGR